jgi:hypothetical protein
MVLRLIREEPKLGYRRVHGELLVLEVKVAASTVCLEGPGIGPAPERAHPARGPVSCAPRPMPCRRDSLTVDLSGPVGSAQIGNIYAHRGGGLGQVAGEQRRLHT